MEQFKEAWELYETTKKTLNGFESITVINSALNGPQSQSLRRQDRLKKMKKKYHDSLSLVLSADKKKKSGYLSLEDDSDESSGDEEEREEFRRYHFLLTFSQLSQEAAKIKAAQDTLFLQWRLKAIHKRLIYVTKASSGNILAGDLLSRKLGAHLQWAFKRIARHGINKHGKRIYMKLSNLILRMKTVAFIRIAMRKPKQFDAETLFPDSASGSPDFLETQTGEDNSVLGSFSLTEDGALTDRSVPASSLKKIQKRIEARQRAEKALRHKSLRSSEIEDNNEKIERQHNRSRSTMDDSREFSNRRGIPFRINKSFYTEEKKNKLSFTVKAAEEEGPLDSFRNVSEMEEEEEEQEREVVRGAQDQNEFFDQNDSVDETAESPRHEVATRINFYDDGSIEEVPIDEEAQEEQQIPTKEYSGFWTWRNITICAIYTAMPIIIIRYANKSK